MKNNNRDQIRKIHLKTVEWGGRNWIHGVSSSRILHEAFIVMLVRQGSNIERTYKIYLIREANISIRRTPSSIIKT